MSEQAGPAATDASAAEAALLAEAATKSGFLWIRPEGSSRAWPAWHVWHEGAVVVVSGPGEQTLPPLEGAVDVVLRSKDSGARLLTLRAEATTIDPGDESWLPAAQALAASRLNSSLSPAQLPDRWRGTNPVTRLSPVGDALEAPGRYDDASGAAPPAPTSATTAGWRPWHLRGRRRRWGRRTPRA